MLSRNLKSLIVAAFCGGLVLFVARGAAQKKADEEPPLNADTTHLIESMDGAALFKAYCATCHGTDGKGIGPMTEWLKIKSPDLTRLSLREGGQFPFARVQRVIAGKENITKGHGTREMPVWGPVFSQVGRDQDLGQMRIYNLAEYLEKIQAKQ